MVSILDKFFNRKAIKEAAAVAVSKMIGIPVVRANTPVGWMDRQITPELISEDRTEHLVLSSLVGLNRMCFYGLDHILKPLDPSDDTQGPRIAKVLAEIRKQEKRIGRVGKSRKVGTLGLVRATALDGWSFRQAVTEFTIIKERNWTNFGEIQHLHARSFGTPSMTSGLDNVADKILPGILYDSQQGRTRFFQTTNGKTTELDSEQILYIEDITVPEETSFMKALVPVIEQWKETRRNCMMAGNRVGVPSRVASIDAKDIAALYQVLGSAVDIDSMIAYCKDLTENQGNTDQAVAVPGVKISYPNISMAMNPWEADAILKKEIVDFFFHRDVIEVTKQAISATNAPTMDLIDVHINSERELWGKPYEGIWNGWLEWNGWEFTDEFAWWNWAPKDIKAEREFQLKCANSGTMTVNDFRKLQGWTTYTDEELVKLKAERDSKPIALTGSGGKGGA